MNRLRAPKALIRLHHIEGRLPIPPERPHSKAEEPECPSRLCPHTTPPLGETGRYTSHFSISIKQELLAIPGAFLEIIRAGVSKLTHPPRSGLPGFPGSRGSYTPDDS